MKKNKKVNYFRIGCRSIAIIILVGLCLSAILYYLKVLNWKDTKSLCITLAGGIIGSIGTLIAVMMSSHQTNKIQQDNNENERIKLAYQNMPVFILAQTEEMTLIYPRQLTKENVEFRGADINCIIKNISNFQVKLIEYSIRLKHSQKSILSSYPGEKSNYMMDINISKHDLVEIGYAEKKYDGSILNMNEIREIKIFIDTTKSVIDMFNVETDKGDIHVEVILSVKNMIGQSYKQKLTGIYSINNMKSFFMGEDIPELLDVGLAKK
ncbi:hypothetical protein KPL40_04300 [Clostridium gasigenes]|uniref:hypothetical protein n=1 Tax=Clostridium gasigenes TaxID=94869 RepID=UPI001C0BEAC5|nr:hypothetical protein [Clostridium gasigenes]MBU3131662.1 hypothetical protein [Clostridium gasigenes]